MRNAVLFRERWGEQLAQTQEPRGDGGAEELERALARAAERRAALDGAPTQFEGRRAAPPPDPVVVAERHLLLHQEYVAELEPALEHFEAETAALREQVTELHALLEERDRQLAEITGGGWWRLRERLLPLIGMAGAVRRRLRRG